MKDRVKKVGWLALAALVVFLLIGISWQSPRKFITIGPDGEDMVQVLCKNIYTDIKTALVDALQNKKDVCGLDVSNQTMFSLAVGVSYIETLKVLDLSGNMMLELPKWLGDMPQLRQLDVSQNRLTSLPDTMTALRGLEVLDLRENPLPQEEVANIRQALPNTKVLF